MRYAFVVFLLISCAGGKQEDQASDGPTIVRASGGQGVRDPGCGITAGAAISDTGLGVLSIGTSVDSVLAACQVIRDVRTLDAEGVPTRILSVDLSWDVVYVVLDDSDRIWRVEIGGAHFRTSDSIGVGTPIEALLRIPGLKAVEGEAVLYAISDARCGLSFRLSYRPTMDERHEQWTHDELQRLPRSVHVDQVAVVRCFTS